MELVQRTFIAHQEDKLGEVSHQEIYEILSYDLQGVDSTTINKLRMFVEETRYREE
jgi:hypothetical protein